DRSRQAVAGMRHAVGRGRAFIEDEAAAVVLPPPFDRLIENAALAPKPQNLFFLVRQIGAGAYWLKHRRSESKVQGLRSKVKTRLSISHRLWTLDFGPWAPVR